MEQNKRIYILFFDTRRIHTVSTQSHLKHFKIIFFGGYPFQNQRGKLYGEPKTNLTFFGQNWFRRNCFQNNSNRENCFQLNCFWWNCPATKLFSVESIFSTMVVGWTVLDETFIKWNRRAAKLLPEKFPEHRAREIMNNVRSLRFPWTGIHYPWRNCPL